MKMRLLMFLVGIVAATAWAANLPQIPDDVARMYVFLQDPKRTERGTGQQIRQLITPARFREEFPQLVETARRQHKKPIVTAQSKSGAWIQDQIIYKGQRLQPAIYYNAGIDQEAPGAEITID